jgi:hypothetical protein
MYVCLPQYGLLLYQTVPGRMDSHILIINQLMSTPSMLKAPSIRWTVVAGERTEPVRFKHYLRDHFHKFGKVPSSLYPIWQIRYLLPLAITSLSILLRGVCCDEAISGIRRLPTTDCFARVC